jgi:integrase/recombinase XerD
LTCDEIQPESWLARLNNDGTRRVYGAAIEEFRQFLAIVGVGDLRTLTRAHVMAWREHLFGRGLGEGTVRHRLAALSSFFEYLCEKEAVAWNPVASVKRPKNLVSASEAHPNEYETQAIWPVY